MDFYLNGRNDGERDRDDQPDVDLGRHPASIVAVHVAPHLLGVIQPEVELYYFSEGIVFMTLN